MKTPSIGLREQLQLAIVLSSSWASPSSSVFLAVRPRPEAGKAVEDFEALTFACSAAIVSVTLSVMLSVLQALKCRKPLL